MEHACKYPIIKESFVHDGHDVDPFWGHMFRIKHSLFRNEENRQYEFRPYAIFKLTSQDFLWDNRLMNTLMGVVAFSCFTDLDWKDDSCSPFIYPSIVSESPYYDQEKERSGKANIDIQVKVEHSLLKAPDGSARSDVMFVLATGDRKHGHFTLVRVKKEEKCITVCDPYRGCCDDRLIHCCASFIKKAYEEFSLGLVEKELSNPRT
jgi:hypothetical protein